ncbi:hypothetical protein HK096_000303, partial [Nowakowskiella sp. JEL0078]
MVLRQFSIEGKIYGDDISNEESNSLEHTMRKELMLMYPNMPYVLNKEFTFKDATLLSDYKIHTQQKLAISDNQKESTNDSVRSSRSISGISAAIRHLFSTVSSHDKLSNDSLNNKKTKQIAVEKMSLEYIAESPDEQALVRAAHCLGVTFLEKSQGYFKIDVWGEKENIELLHTLEFDSTRKRMS